MLVKTIEKTCRNSGLLFGWLALRAAVFVPKNTHFSPMVEHKHAILEQVNAAIFGEEVRHAIFFHPNGRCRPKQVYMRFCIHHHNWGGPLVFIAILYTTVGLLWEAELKDPALSQAYRLADAATVAPFEYVGLPLAVFWGLVIFGDLPEWEVWVGISLIMGSGLFVFLRERQKARQVEGRVRGRF